MFPVVNCETIVVENRLNNKPTITQKIVDHAKEIKSVRKRMSSIKKNTPTDTTAVAVPTESNADTGERTD